MSVFQNILFSSFVHTILVSNVYGKTYDRKNVYDKDFLIGKYTYGNMENNFVYCDEGKFVSGVTIFFDNNGGDDEGALTAQLICMEPDDIFSIDKFITLEAEILESDDWDVATGDGSSDYGINDFKFCNINNPGLITGFRAGDGYWSGYGMVTLQAKCSDNSLITPHENYLQDNGWDGYYTWGEWQTCPNGYAVCGYKQRIDPSGSTDDTGLNQIEFKCCKLSIPKGCTVIEYKRDDPELFISRVTVANYIEGFTYKNEAAIDRTFTTPSQEKCVDTETSFTYTSGEELSYEIGVGYHFSAGFNIADISKMEAGWNVEFTYNSKYYEEFQRTTTKTESVCKEKPSEDILCPARTICTRKYVVLRPSTTEVPMTLISKCEDGERRETKGVFEIAGGSQIDVVENHIPLDCPHYTNDYYARGEGKLPFCDTCAVDADETNICDICRDSYILLDGQCVTESVCEDTCGGKVMGGSAESELNVEIPFSGAYCDILPGQDNQNKYCSIQCQNELGNDLLPISCTSTTTTPPTTTTIARTPTNSDKKYIYNKHSDKYLQCGNDNSIFQSEYTGDENQKFLVNYYNGDNYYFTIQCVTNGLFWNFDESNKLILSTSINHFDIWQISTNDSNDPVVAFINQITKECIEVIDYATVDGAKLQQTSFIGADNQLFGMEQIESVI